MNADPNPNSNLHALDLAALCKRAAHLDGQWPLAALPRLATSLAASTDDSVQWSADASLKTVTGAEAQRWLHVSASSRVPLVCQRCLNPYVQALEVNRHFRFVRDEQEAAKLDEESDDDVLSLPTRLDLIELLEDELILALPLVPKHEADCPPGQVPASAATAAEDAPSSANPGTRANPFAVLASLRKGS